MGIRAWPFVIVALVGVVGCTRPENADGTADAEPASSIEPGAATVAASTTATTVGPAVSSTSTTDPGGATTTTGGPATSTTTASTTPTPTTAPDTAPSTTTAPPAGESDLTLAADGLLPLRFGDRDVDVVPALTAVLGPPDSDTSTEYPTAEEGLFLDSSGDEAFIAPFGRAVCWSDGLCVHFGAGAPETRIFTGWAIAPTTSGDATSSLTTAGGIGLGTVLADVADQVSYDPAAACFSVAFGFAAGVELTLQSSDGVFSAPNEDGSGVVLGDPDPAAVTVTQLGAGERPFFVFADC